jgi:hypothetical protein
MSKDIDLKKHIRSIPDFPKPGILFYDISTLLAHAKAWHTTIERLVGVCRRDRRLVVGGDLEALVALLARHVQTPLGRKRVMALVPSTDRDHINAELGELYEQESIKRSSRVPISMRNVVGHRFGSRNLNAVCRKNYAKFISVGLCLGRQAIADGLSLVPLLRDPPLQKGRCERIPLGVWTWFGRDAVLRVSVGFPGADAQQRVPTLEFFHSFGESGSHTY